MIPRTLVGPLVALALATAAASPTAARAQQGTSVGGRWEARWAPGVRTERDGSVTVTREADAVLTLEAAGDTLAGIWTFELPGVGRSTWRVQGRFADGRLSLVATEREPPDTPEIVRQEWTAAVRDGRLGGEHWMILALPDGSEKRSGPRPWSAPRSRE